MNEVWLLYLKFFAEAHVYAQRQKLPVVRDQIQSKYSDKLTQLDIKGTKMISEQLSELAAKHR